MQRVLLATAVATIAATSSLSAQAVAPAHEGFRDEFLMQFESSMQRLISLAEAMPAESYTWSPGEGVMPVAQVYAHIAHYNYAYPTDRLGVPLPAGISLETMESTAEKAQVLALLRDSHRFVREAVADLPASALNGSAQLYGREVGGWAVLFQLLAHMNEHLGQSIAYARMNDVVPPWSQ